MPILLVLLSKNYHREHALSSRISLINIEKYRNLLLKETAMPTDNPRKIFSLDIFSKFWENILYCIGHDNPKDNEWGKMAMLLYLRTIPHRAVVFRNFLYYLRTKK